MKIFPSLLGVQNPLQLQDIVLALNYRCSGFHIDIMDNHFVPNLTWGVQLTNAIDLVARAPLWVHLMVSNPLSIIERLTIKKSSIVSFHIETVLDPFAICEKIASHKWKPSIALKPSTPIERIFPYLSDAVHPLIMSVDPGFSGQAFLPSTLARLEALIIFQNNNDLHFRIGIDGGINTQTIKKVASYGVDAAAIASAIFNTSDHLNAINELDAASHVI